MRLPTPLALLTATKRRMALGLVILVAAGAVASAGLLTGDDSDVAAVEPRHERFGSERRFERADRSDGTTPPTTETTDPDVPSTTTPTTEPKSRRTPAPETPSSLTSAIDLDPHSGPDIDPADDPVDLGPDPANAGIPASFHAPGVPTPGPSTPHDPGFGYSVGTGCASDCIDSGVAYPVGSGANLVVKTDTPARIWIVVWNDDHTFSEASGGLTTEFSHLFDDLEPDTDYFAMAVAEDANGYTNHEYGEFETLSPLMKVSLDAGTLLEYPADSDPSNVYIDVWVDHQHVPNAWDEGIPLMNERSDVDVRIRLFTYKGEQTCNVAPTGDVFPDGPGFDATCFTWVQLGHWVDDDTPGSVDLSALGDDNSVVAELTRAPVIDDDGHVDIPLDAEVTMTVERVYV